MIGAKRVSISFVEAAPCGRRGLVACQAKKKPQDVTYGQDWYETTRDLGAPKTVREQLERYKKANLEANNGLERKDLYTDKWAGDQYTGSRFNILTVLAGLFFFTPVVGLIIAYFTYGIYWG
ncbi:hypothetical protein BSKO_12367 [Bryopsis sp. KO-2023]|nr:hypothetical protein BSKO_12367 [Bryopsis sp. KO-2023]